MNKARTTLKRKLISNIALILVISFSLVSTLVYYGLSNLSAKFLELSETRSRQVKVDLEDFSSESTERIKKRFFKALNDKGIKLIRKDSLSLLTNFNDNSFFQVRDFLQNSFRDDPDIIHASFFVLEDGEVKAWQFLNNEFAEGTSMPLVYDRKVQRWTGTYKDKSISIDDSRTNEIVSSLKFSTKIMKILDSDGEEVEVLDVAIPVYEGIGNENYEKLLKDAISEEEAIGFLRYTLSMSQMHKAIKEEKGNLGLYLEKLEQENARAATETNSTGERLLKKILLILGAAAFLIMFGSYLVVNVFSGKITNPLMSLISVAEKISKGEYKQKINVSTDDEIGVLADTFQVMSDAIVRRDTELEELNKGLEKLVAERTKQLNIEMKKVRNLLDSMKQSVFSIDSKGIVVAPVSKFTETIFDQCLDGKNIFSNLYKDFLDRSEGMVALKTAMATVFGEDDLQWMLMEDNLPSRVVLNASSDQEKILKISYNPIWDEDGLLSQIMYVVDDITELEKLERQRNEGIEKMNILLELSGRSESELRNYFSGAKELFTEADKTINLDLDLSEIRSQLLSTLHTLKGNSRVFGMTTLSSKIHEVESILVQGNDSDESRAFSISDIKESFFLAKDLYQKYLDYAKDVFKLDFSINSSSKSDQKEMGYLKDSLRRFESIALDDAASLGKEVSMNITGEDIPLDGEKLEKVNSAIMHIVQNSIDHGIEDSSTRESLGKNKCARISVDLSEDSEKLTIMIIDDGRGLDLEKLKTRAVERKLYSEKDIENMNVSELESLVFEKELSTKDNVSHISGRGIGMSAVKEIIESLNGQVSISSSAGRGISIKIEIFKEFSGKINKKHVA